MTAAKAAYLPDLSLGYFYGIDAPEFALKGPDGTHNLGYSAVVTLDIPVWDWFATRSRVKQVAIRSDLANVELTATQRQLIASIEVLYNETAVAVQQVASFDETVRTAAESLRLTNLRYTAGEASVLDVVDAQNSYSLAEAAKVEAMRELGATVNLVGADFDEAREACERQAVAEGYRYIHSGNEPLLIAGVATHTLEILTEEPRIDVIIVPVGGGSGAAGACIVAKTVNPRIAVIGVQAEKAPSAYLTWRSRKPVEASTSTWAEGLATRTPFELPQRIIQRLLDDFVLVSEEAISDAVRFLLARNRILVEGAGAAALAAAFALKDRLANQRVALILTGGNISTVQLKTVLDGA